SPAIAGPVADTDGDGVLDHLDNCTLAANPAQVDTDGDFCGNRCDADYDNTGLVGFLDFSQFSAAYATFDLEKDHTEPMTGPVGFLDFSFFSSRYASTPGPSGTTPGTTACP
ncbi:MAG TPA: thrombospondin type 3 repeat-containing protein, partial [Myxococcota bacterium]|nr:thrombospondin type 3 repeat-containing protein [Myxococcota bacterium]